jgi:hypothetical protein
MRHPGLLQVGGIVSTSLGSLYSLGEASNDAPEAPARRGALKASGAAQPCLPDKVHSCAKAQHNYIVKGYILNFYRAGWTNPRQVLDQGIHHIAEQHSDA